MGQRVGRPQNKAEGKAESVEPSRCASGAVHSTSNERAPPGRKGGVLARRAAIANDQASRGGQNRLKQYKSTA